LPVPTASAPQPERAALEALVDELADLAADLFLEGQLEPAPEELKVRVKR
jgi:hypothetical protein